MKNKDPVGCQVRGSSSKVGDLVGKTLLCYCLAVGLSQAAVVTTLPAVEILGQSYTVTFHPNRSFQDVFDQDADYVWGGGTSLVDHQPLYLNDASGAQAAAVAITGALGLNDTISVESGDSFAVPYSVEDSNYNRPTDNILGLGDYDNRAGVDMIGVVMYTERLNQLITREVVATFELNPAAVPLPPALILMLMAIVPLARFSHTHKNT